MFNQLAKNTKTENGFPTTSKPSSHFDSDESVMAADKSLEF